jgi:hypothetical protein
MAAAPRPADAGQSADEVDDEVELVDVDPDDESPDEELEDEELEEESLDDPESESLLDEPPLAVVELLAPLASLR